jgi:hypothetical protein
MEIPSFGVEPNAEMREAGERLLVGISEVYQHRGNCRSYYGCRLRPWISSPPRKRAHWFHREHARREFVRILEPGGWLVLLWNERLTDSTAFLRDYEQLLLTYGTDYQDIRHEKTTDRR